MVRFNRVEVIFNGDNVMYFFCKLVGGGGSIVRIRKYWVRLCFEKGNI